MGFRMIAPKRLRKAKTKNSKEILNRLEEYLKSVTVTGEFVKVLCGFWEDQQNAITYQELRQIVQDGSVEQETLQLWAQDYSILVANQLNGMWMDAVIAGSKGQPILDNLTFEFNSQSSGILNWIKERGAEFVTASSQEQKNAIAALLTKKMKDGHTVDELSRLIRPCIGLTESDAKAAVRFYDNIVANLRKDHPRMKLENIRRKALDAAQKYAERKHRARAMTIAQTESAFAYNRGTDEGLRQAQAAGYLGTMRKRWCTSGDDAVCGLCKSFEGVEINMDAEFEIKGKVLFPGHHLMPPAHPRCACAVEYIEVGPPVNIPQVETLITQADSFRKYSTEEVESIAEQTEAVASKHISIPSKWSGRLVIDDEGVKNPDGYTTHYGKLWNCDILTKHETAPSLILHEQLHARSISHYGYNEYAQYHNIEEASVQLMVEEICKVENIEVILSGYDDSVEALRQIGRRIGAYKTDYEFAQKIFEVPVVDRFDWLSDRLYAILGNDPAATLEEFQWFAELLNVLY